MDVQRRGRRLDPAAVVEVGQRGLGQFPVERLGGVEARQQRAGEQAAEFRLGLGGGEQREVGQLPRPGEPGGGGSPRARAARSALCAASRSTRMRPLSFVPIETRPG
ncbi:hypothetical protein [Actinomadura sp. NPDC049753]|uniref:hypothetical protein n=1 Tax=Actinomadura sp. NPDC049753 TaxID=3154739 RepID=UPI0034433BF5